MSKLRLLLAVVETPIAVTWDWSLLQCMDVFQYAFDLRIRDLSTKGRHLVVLAVLDNAGKIGVRQFSNLRGVVRNLGRVVRSSRQGLTHRRIAVPIAIVPYLALRLENIRSGVLSKLWPHLARKRIGQENRKYLQLRVSQ